MKHFNLIANRNIFLGISGAMMLASWLLVATVGLKQGIDLRGGTQWEVSFPSSTVSVEQIQVAIAPLVQQSEHFVKQNESGAFTLRLPSMDEAGHASYRQALSAVGAYSENSFSSIGPTIGVELRNRAVRAVIAVLVGISLFIAYAFRKVSKPISSWKYGFATLITLVHDVSIPMGLLSILGWYKGIEIDTNFIVALLVVMGFSVHDTIVVFDRIRENIMIHRGKGSSLADIINHSVRETFARSINTTLTLVIVLIALLVFGPSSLYYFILTILVGTVFGTYSSIFLASPILYIWGNKSSR
jgi:preprotein translocase subunit SecF